MIKTFEQYNLQLKESLSEKDTFTDSIEKYKKLIETHQKILSKCETETLPETIEKKISIGKEIYDILNNDYYRRKINLDGKITIYDYYHNDSSYIYEFFAISDGNCNMHVKRRGGLGQGNKNFIDHISLEECEEILNLIKKKVDLSIKMRERISDKKNNSLPKQ